MVFFVKTRALPIAGFLWIVRPASAFSTSNFAMAPSHWAQARLQQRAKQSVVGLEPQRGLRSRTQMAVDTAEVASVIEKMDSWISCITPDGHSKRNIRYTVSEGTTLTEVFADFWKAVSQCVDEHRAAGEFEPFRLLHMVVAPFCPALEDYDTMQKADQLFSHCASAGGCEEFGRPITVLHYHPNFRGSKPEATRQSFRHSPFPAFSLNVFYKAGGLAANLAPPPPPPVGRRAQPPPAAGAGAAASAARGRRSDKPQAGRPKAAGAKGGDAGKGDKDKEWIRRTAAALEALYNRAAASSSNDRVDTHGAPHNDIPESSQEILEATQSWIRQVVAESADSKNSDFPSTVLARHMGNVAQCVVTRSKTAENVYADVWEAVVDLVKRARNVGCDVSTLTGTAGRDAAASAAAAASPCTSAMLVTPEFSTFNAELFKKFGETINRGLRHLPSADDVSVEMFHPEYVSDTSDNHTFRRAPYPSVHIRYHGLRSTEKDGSGDGPDAASDMRCGI